MRKRLRTFLLYLWHRTADPPPDQSSTIRHLSNALVELSTRDNQERAKYMERVAELVEARQMAGAGPWSVPPSVLAQTDRMITEAQKRFNEPAVSLRESVLSQGVNGEIELALQNVEWRREVNLSWLEFSRWGIQQLILICRLHYIKNPWIRRGVNLSAAYVFGQGVEISSPDEAANKALARFRERNKVSLGQIALVEQEKRKAYDGNVFWVLFPDSQDSGDTNVRVIDATEIEEIVCDPEDADTPQYYRRVWTQRTFNLATASFDVKSGKRWYPALNYDPAEKPKMIGDVEVTWDARVYHRKVGNIGGWRFGCPRVYPAMDWAKEGRRILEACASVTQALAQIALTLTTKGGQQALEGVKQQLGTTVGPGSSIYDQNPPAGAGSTFASGPGTKLDVFRTRGAGSDPAEVKEYRNMAACALEIPPTWLGDMETSNLSTAQTLDRPTELGFLLKQEEWQEDLVVMCTYALKVSHAAPSGFLREAKKDAPVVIREAARKHVNGHWVYEAEKKPAPGVIEILCTFPAIREGDIPALVKATAEAMVVDKNGASHGIDEKAAARKLLNLLGVDEVDEIVEQMYPAKTYNPDRTQREQPVAQPAPDGTEPPASVSESKRIKAALARVEAAIAVREHRHVEHAHQ
jgi:hypothetical protein